jgi:2-polyprenyl-3-methyl-5-hydroxy-6-metoxy-1,4-benzoquinol methylase
VSEIDRNLRAVAQGFQYDAIADRIAQLAPQRVLDWGAGWGQMTQRIRARGITCEAYDYWPDKPAGVDAHPGFEDVQVRHSTETVALPYGDGEFDLVLSCGVLEHVSDPAASLVELHRITAPGGRLLIYNLPNRFSYLERIAQYSGRYYHGALEHDRVYTRRSAAAIVAGAGWRVEEARLRNLLPLSIPNETLNRFATPVWKISQALSHVPILSLVATSVEVEATRPGPLTLAPPTAAATATATA